MKYNYRVIAVCFLLAILFVSTITKLDNRTYIKSSTNVINSDQDNVEIASVPNQISNFLL